MPARLVGGRLQDGPTPRIAGQAEIARGPLNEMVLLATDKEADESLMICLELAGNPMPLTWKDIVALRREPGFPVEI
jgi:hypothetical protein